VRQAEQFAGIARGALPPRSTMPDNAAMEAEPLDLDCSKGNRRILRAWLWTLVIFATVVAVPSTALFLLPRSNELTRQQLDSVKTGMSEDQVRDLLGRPDSIKPNENGGVDWNYGILYPDRIEFKAGRVVSAVRF
jgi:hypothetical protein